MASIKSGHRPSFQEARRPDHESDEDYRQGVGDEDTMTVVKWLFLYIGGLFVGVLVLGLQIFGNSQVIL